MVAIPSPPHCGCVVGGDQAVQDLPDLGMAVHGAQVPWGKVVIDGVPVVVTAGSCQAGFANCRRVRPQRVVDMADRARVRFQAAA